MGNAAGVGPSIAGSSDAGASVAEVESASVDYSSEDRLEQLSSKFKGQQEVVCGSGWGWGCVVRILLLIVHSR